MNAEETIAAIASAPGGAARGIVRISGPHAVACLRRCLPSPLGDPLTRQRRPRVLAGTVDTEPPLGEVPCDIYLWPGTSSYTRQPLAEIHTLGSPPLLDAVLSAVCRAGARLAQPGEFTLRAFLAGRIDLTQAEAVLGVIDACSRRELQVALAQLAGGLAGPLHQLRQHLLNLLADIEAGLDFVDDDLQFITPPQQDEQLAQSLAQLDQLIDRMQARSDRPASLRVALIGCPNVGKSSLFNALARTPSALVSDAAGTTRDYVTTPFACQGLEGLLIDTAGVESGAESELVAAAQAAASQQRQQASLQLLCLDATRPLNAWERAAIADPPAGDRLLVVTKIDEPCQFELPAGAIATSSRTGAGLEQLQRAIAHYAADSSGGEGAVVGATAVRCRESLRQARSALGEARQAALHGIGEELVAAEIRIALEELGKVVGAVYTEDLLDRIFSRFCIGK